MTQTIYAIWPTSDEIVPITTQLVASIQQDWWNYEVIKQSDFENAEHVVKAVGPDYEPATTDECGDVSYATTSVWTFSDRTWDWLPELAQSGCRIAHKVKSEKGSKQFKLVYPAPIVDLLDYERSEYTLNGVTNTISHIRKHCLYEWAGELPMMFHLLLKHPATYRGVTVSPTTGTFASQRFADEYARRGLTGIDLIPMERTKRPANIEEPKNVIVYSP